jgi:mono/diheme cytochrome c family protein
MSSRSEPLRWSIPAGIAALSTMLVVSAFGTQASSQQEQAGAQGGEAAAVDGSMIYTRAGCVACHGREGGGGIGPALADNPNLETVEAPVAQVLFGKGRMPAFGNRLSNEEVAAVVTYIRTSFGNDFGEVTVEEVAEVREAGP